MGNPIQGTNVFGPVVPFNTDDIYASHKALYGQGGWRTVKDLTERNSILLDRREDLMIVAVEDNSFIGSTSGVAFYLLDVNHSASTSSSLLDNNNWVLLNFGYGVDGWIFPPPPQSVYTGNKGQRSFDDTYLYICVEDNLWKRVAIDWFIDNGTAGFSGGTSGLNFGDVPIWGTDGQWSFDLVVKNIEAIDSTAGNLLVTFTNNFQKIIEVGGDRWVLPPPMSSVWVGEAGDRSYDDNYFYVCVQDNLWKRSAYDYFIFGGSTSGGGGSFFSLPNGYVPIWNSTLGNWQFNKVVSNVYYDSTNGELNVQFTNNYTTSFSIDVVELLSDLSDVTINSATNGDILTYNGSEWINQLFPGVKWTLPAPLTSVSSGKAGDLSYDDNFIYVCIDTNLWKRINIDYFVFSGSTSGGFTLPFGSVPFWNGASYDTFFAVSKIEPSIQSGIYGELITYTSGTTSFISFGTSGILSNIVLNDLADVNVNVSSTSGVNDYLIWNGFNWINSTLVVPNATTSGNGLTSVGYDIELGGILTKNTVIEGTNFNFIFNVNDFIVNAGTNSIIFKILDSEKLKINLDGIGINTQNNINNFVYLKNDLLTSKKTFQFLNKSGTLALNEDLIAATSGLWNAINNATTENTTAGNGLTITDDNKTIELGGELIKETEIQVNKQLNFAIDYANNALIGFGNPFEGRLLLNGTDGNVSPFISLVVNNKFNSQKNIIGILPSSTTILSEDDIYTHNFSVRSNNLDMFTNDISTYKMKIFNSLGSTTQLGFLNSTSGLTRNINFPDASGTLALLTDITTNASGTNGLKNYGGNVGIGGLIDRPTRIQLDSNFSANSSFSITDSFWHDNITPTFGTSGLFINHDNFFQNFELTGFSTVGIANKRGVAHYQTSTMFGSLHPDYTNNSVASNNKVYAGLLFDESLNTFSFIKDGEESINFARKEAYGKGGFGLLTIDWGNHKLYSTSGTVATSNVSIDWADRKLFSSNGQVKIDWLKSQLFDNNNNIILDFSNDFSITSNNGKVVATSVNDSVDLIKSTSSYVRISNHGSSNHANLDVSLLTADRTFEFPNATGTIALNEDLVAATSGLWNAINNVTIENTTAGNGLSMSGNIVKMGGNLTEDTYIEGDYDLRLGDSVSLNSFSVSTTNGNILTNYNGDIDNRFELSNTDISLQYFNTSTNILSGIKLDEDGIKLITNFSNSFASVLKTTNLTADRTFEFPDASGTLALNEDLIAATSGLWDAINTLSSIDTLKKPDTWSPNGSYPTTWYSEPIEAGDTWRITSAGTMGSVVVNIEDLLIALTDVPSQTDSNFMIIESNRDQATESIKGVAAIATTSEVTAGTNDTDFVTPLKLQQKINTVSNNLTVYGSNGITKTDNTFKLGGTLIENTQIEGDFDLTFKDNKSLNIENKILSFNSGGSGFENSVRRVILQDSKILVGGVFTTYNGVTCPSRLVRLNANGSIDSTFNTSGTGFNNTVSSLFIQSDGKILVGGDFTTYNGVTCPRGTVRLNADGSIDSTFNTGGAGFNAIVNRVIELSDGKILVGGNFTTYNGVTCSARLVRLNADGSIDSTFNTGGAGFNTSTVITIEVQSDDKILVGGIFTTYNGVNCPDRLVRLNANGSIDSTFNSGGAGFNTSVFIVKLLSDGKMLVGGGFTTYNGVTCPSRLVRLNANGSIDSTFNSGGTGFDTSNIVDIWLLSDGKILVGGGFTTYNGVNCPDGLVRLNANGSIDSTFNTGGTGFDSSIQSFLVENDESIYVGGNFTSYNGTNCPDRLVKLDINGVLDSDINVKIFIDKTNGLLKHDDDYSEYYTNRTLVDKEYVDNAINNIVSENTTAGNGLKMANDNKTIKLGGELIESTTINTNSNLFTIQGTTGLRYFTDYSEYYNKRSLVDKEYVDSKNTILYTQLITQSRIGDGVNSQSEVSLLSSSSGNLGSTTINANTLKVGDIIKLKVRGYMNVSATGTFTFNIKLGSTILVSRASVIISHPKTNQLYDLEFEMMVRSIGSSGKILGNGVMIISVGNVATPVTAEFVMTNAATIDTTSNQILDFTVSWTSGFSGNLNTTTAYIKKEKN